MIDIFLKSGILGCIGAIVYNGGMKELRNNLTILLAQKAKRERRRISLKKVSDETGVNKYTVYAIANDTIKEYSKDVLVKLCGYLDCEVGDLLTIEESEAQP